MRGWYMVVVEAEYQRWAEAAGVDLSMLYWQDVLVLALNSMSALLPVQDAVQARHLFLFDLLLEMRIDGTLSPENIKMLEYGCVQTDIAAT
jgi:hypothetical protein